MHSHAAVSVCKRTLYVHYADNVQFMYNTHSCTINVNMYIYCTSRTLYEHHCVRYNVRIALKVSD